MSEITVTTRSDIAEADTWDIDALYNEETWKADFVTLKENFKDFEQYRGTLSESPERLQKAMTDYFKFYRNISALYSYAVHKKDEDTTNTKNLGRLQQIKYVSTQFSAITSFVSPELLSIDEHTLKDWLDLPGLQDWKRFIEDTTRYRPHILSEKEEALLAGAGEVFSSASLIFTQLVDGDFEFGTIVINGEKTPLTHSSYGEALRHTDRALREDAYGKYYAVYDSHKNTLSSSLAASIKKDVYLAKVKHYDSSLSKALFSEHVSEDVYNTLIESVRDALPALNDYYQIRKEILGLNEMCLYDTYVPCVSDVTIPFSYDEAVELVVESCEPLGEEYCDILRKGLTTARWVDRYENKGKRSGAYSGGCYDSHPYILMNYNQNVLNSVFTLAHEAGHSMHSYFSRKHQNFQDSHYGIFVAEVASTLNEALLHDHLMKRYANETQILRYLLNSQIDDIKATLFRQTMFSEFEKETHEKAEAGEPLTVDTFRIIYRELLSSYFGKAVTLNEVDTLECFRIPHFYYGFYVYKYATGITAAISLSTAILKGDTDATHRYLQFLKAGCSKYPLEVLQDAGVDLTSKAPYEKTFTHFKSLVESFRSLQED